MAPLFMVDLHQAVGNGLTVRLIANMVTHETNELFFENLEISDDQLIGEAGKGFRYILDGLNAERTLVAAECIGDWRWFIDRARTYARDRVVFGRSIRHIQGVQFPLAEAHIEVEAADLMRLLACALFDAQQPCGAQANMAQFWPRRRRGKRAMPACRRMAASVSPRSTTWNARFARHVCSKWHRCPPTWSWLTSPSTCWASGTAGRLRRGPNGTCSSATNRMNCSTAALSRHWRRFNESAPSTPRCVLQEGLLSPSPIRAQRGRWRR